jgi:hypothetical protein
MTSNPSRGPEPFSLSPLLSLLPSLGSVTRLELLVSSLFARYESFARSEAGDAVETAEQRARSVSEAAMLRQILDWLAVQPKQEDGDE